MKSVDFHGYTIYEDGTVIGLHGKKIKINLNAGRYEVGLRIENKRVTYMLSRLVYYVFCPFDINDKDLCVSFKDNDKLNVHLDNLFLIQRKDLIQGDKHIARAKLSDEQVEEIRNLYKGKSGGNQFDKVGYSLKDLADKYGVTKSNIMWIVRGMSRNEDDYKLK